MNYSIAEIKPFSSGIFYQGTPENVDNTIFVLLSNLCNLQIDTELFKHKLPMTICDAVCGNITGEVSSAEPGTRCFPYKLVCRGSYENSKIFSKLNRLLARAGEPLFWKIIPDRGQYPVIIQSFTSQSEWNSSMTSFGGTIVPVISWDLQFRIVQEV
jgi:hypothetical protein